MPKGYRKPRLVRSCTECKQVKLRCDAKATAPRPCSRCSDKGLNCIVDAAFRRTPARRRLEELNREVRHLRQSLKDAQSRDYSPHPHNTTSRDNFSRSPSRNNQLSLLDLEAEAEADQLGDCVFTRDDLLSIFSMFDCYFRHHLPIIGPLRTHRDLQRSSPFLFWTIVMIVVQRVPRADHERRSALLIAYRPLLEKAVLATPLTLSTIEALLYLCCWPLAVDYQARDQSWTLIAVTINAALYSGLHKPAHPQSLRSVGVFVDSHLRSSLWLACFYLSTDLSQSIGVSPVIRSPDDLAAISRLASNEIIPRELAAMVEIQVCVAKYTTLVSESAQCHLANSLECAFVSELDQTKDRFATRWNQDIEFIYLKARLHLIATLAVGQSKHLASTTEAPARSHSDPQLTVALADGLSCAVRLIQVLCHGDTSTDLRNSPLRDVAPRSEIYMKGFPKLYFRGLVFTAFYLLRYHVSGRMTPAADWHLACEHVEIAYTYLRSQSSRPTDEPGRAAVVVQTLFEYTKALPNGCMGPMRIHERLGASIFYDALTRAHELRARPVKLSDDQEQPQQKMTMKMKASAHDGETETRNAGLVDQNTIETTTEGEEYFADLPEDWLEHLDLDMMQLSGELFTGVATFT